MEVFHGVSEARGLTRHALALGNFDGVHVGHQALFREARDHGPAAVFTFQPHPGKVLQPELAPKLITPLARKLELIESLGVAAVVVQPFSQEYARTPASVFEGALLDTLGVRALVAGADFTYGAGRAGTCESLRAAAAKRGGALHTVPPVTVDGVVASSSKIREYILEGRVSAA